MDWTLSGSVFVLVLIISLYLHIMITMLLSGLGRDSQKVLSLGNFFAWTNLKVMTFVLAKISLKLGFTKSA